MTHDHEGEELIPVHVLPYRVCSEEYGDYAFTKTHDERELTAATLPELAEKLRALVVKYALAWADGRPGWGGRIELPSPHSLEQLKFGRDRYGDFTNLCGKIARAPENSLHFIEIGAYRIELRHGVDRSAPSLPEASHGFEEIVPALEAALVEARTRLAATIEQRKEAMRVAAEAEKRAQLARLKAELGES